LVWSNGVVPLAVEFGPREIDRLHPRLHHEGHLDDAIAAVEGCGARLIVLDTLSRLMAGGDENSPGDMGAFIVNVTRLRHETKAHVAIVHHGTKASNGTTPRGHSSLTGPMTR
jgi:RecA-family ATPase